MYSNYLLHANQKLLFLNYLSKVSTNEIILSF